MGGDRKKLDRLLALIFSGGIYSAIVAPVTGLIVIQIGTGYEGIIYFIYFVRALAIGSIWFAPVCFFVGSMAAVLVFALSQRGGGRLRTAMKAVLVGGSAGAIFGVPGVSAGMVTGFTYAIIFGRLLHPLAESSAAN
jgi:hypothetical protein